MALRKRRAGSKSCSGRGLASTSGQSRIAPCDTAWAVPTPALTLEGGSGAPSRPSSPVQNPELWDCPGKGWSCSLLLLWDALRGVWDGESPGGSAWILWKERQQAEGWHVLGITQFWGEIWVEKQICCSSVEISSLEGMGVWGSAVSAQHHPQNCSAFFPHSLSFPIPNCLLPHISMSFFSLFCVGSRRERIRDKAGSRGVQGDLFPSPNADFSSQHIQKTQILFLKLLFPQKQKDKTKEMFSTSHLPEIQFRTCGKHLDSSRRGLSWKDEDAPAEVIQSCCVLGGTQDKPKLTFPWKVPAFRQPYSKLGLLPFRSNTGSPSFA